VKRNKIITKAKKYRDRIRHKSEKNGRGKILKILIRNFSY